MELQLISKQIEPLRGDELAHALCELIKYFLRIETKCQIALGYLFSCMKRNWKNFSEEFRATWDGNFWTFATKVTGKHRTTVDNYIRLWETWFEGRYKIPENVHPETIDPTKLIMFSSRLRRGAMTQDDWDMLANPNASWQDIRRHLLSPGRVEPEMRLFIDATGRLFVERGAFSEVVGTLMISSDDALIQKAISHIISKAHIIKLKG